MRIIRPTCRGLSRGGPTCAGNRSDHAKARRVRAELLGGPRPGRDRRDRRRDPRDGRLHAARRGPRRVHEPHRLHLRRRARGRGRGRARRGARRPRADRHADAEGRAPPRRGDGRLPVRPGLGRDDGRLRGASRTTSAARGGRARRPRLPLRPRGEGRPPPHAPADPGGGVRGARRSGSGSRSGSPTTARPSSCRSGERRARARATS